MSVVNCDNAITHYTRLNVARDLQTRYNVGMKNKAVRVVIEVLLGLVLVSVGNSIGGVVGNLITIFGGIAVVYAIVEASKKQKPPTTT
jgi:hypothetical protein